MTITPPAPAPINAAREPRPFFRVVNQSTYATVLTLQARDPVDAGFRLLTVLAVSSKAHWLQEHVGHQLDVEPHPAGAPFHAPVFNDGFFEVLQDYVSSLDAPPH